MGADQILTAGGHHSNILACGRMEDLPGAEGACEYNNSHDWVSTRVTDPVLLVKVLEVDIGVVLADLGHGSSPVWD